MTRRTLVLEAPEESAHDFTKFPARNLAAGSIWYRQHQDRSTADRGAWYFASHPAGVVGDGRFDLEEPNGTCYLASTPTAAINELLGPDHPSRGWVDATLVAGRVLSRLPLPEATRAATTTTAPAAAFGVTLEITATDRYDITQAWADAWHRAGFGGVYHSLRFSPGSARGVALFGPAGAPDPPTPGHPDPPTPGDPDPQPLRPLVEDMGIEVIDPPAFAAVTVVAP